MANKYSELADSLWTEDPTFWRWSPSSEYLSFVWHHHGCSSKDLLWKKIKSVM